MVILDGYDAPASVPPPPDVRRRRDWVRAEVRCLMCGRLVGRLLGQPRTRDRGERTAGQPVCFIAYRPLNPVACIVPFTPRLRFRCGVCSGVGALGDIELFSTYDEAPEDGPAELSDL